MPFTFLNSFFESKASQHAETLIIAYFTPLAEITVLMCLMEIYINSI